MRFRLLAVVPMVWVVMALNSCAYSIGTGERRLPEGYRLIAVPIFKNLTQEAGVEVPFTNAMIRELERNQIARVVSKSGAQVILDGTIVSIAYTVTNQKADGVGIPRATILNTEYRINMVLKLSLRRVSDGTPIWAEEFQGERSYLAPKIGLEGLNSANALYNHSARYDNLSAMATDLMAEAHSRLTENF